VLRPDPREFTSVRWWSFDELRTPPALDALNSTRPLPHKPNVYRLTGNALDGSQRPESRSRRLTIGNR
jgi:hypothetical protein